MLITAVLWCIYLQSGYAQSTGLFGLYGVQRVCLCRCGISSVNLGNTRTGRNPGDISVLPHEYPWLVAIHIGPKLLAGSLISDKHVLTAASPLYGITPERITVTLGAHDRCIIGGSALNVSVDYITICPGYSSSRVTNDLALVRLRHAVAFSRYISPICLPMFGPRDAEQVTWTAGWSINNSTCIPQVAVLPTLQTATCTKIGDSKLETSDKGCLGPLGVKSVICKDDIGSPVMSRRSATAALRLVGVVSTSSCDVTTPPIYTRVYDHVGWIYENIRRDCQCL